MQITYDPDNLSSAARYLVGAGVASADIIQEWIEEKTIPKVNAVTPNDSDFTVLYRGIGFFQSRDGLSSAPRFQSSIQGSDKESDGVIEVTFWVAADAAK